MEAQPQETKIDNLRVHSTAKSKIRLVVEAIRTKRGIKPTLTEAVEIMADHFMATAA